MKTKRNAVKSGILTSMLAAGMLALGACTGQSPVGPEADASAGSLQFLKVGKFTPTLAKPMLAVAADEIQNDKGGMLQVTFESEKTSLQIGMRAQLQPGSLSATSTVQLSLNHHEFFKGTLEVKEGSPALSVPAMLNLSIRNADLSMLNPELIGAYYRDSESGTWQELAHEALHVDFQSGSIELINAHLPEMTSFALYPMPDGGIIDDDISFVSFDRGGELLIDYKGLENGAGAEEVRVTFKVFEQTISEENYLWLQLGGGLLSGSVDAVFHPHGTQFSSPALLNIEAKNIDLSGVDPKSIGLYYDNQETGAWEPMVTKQVIVKPEEGYLKIIDAQIPHFSRYAVAMSQ